MDSDRSKTAKASETITVLATVACEAAAICFAVGAAAFRSLATRAFSTRSTDAPITATADATKAQRRGKSTR